MAVTRRQALQRVARSTRRLDDSRSGWLNAIWLAADRGCSHQEIADAAGVTRQRISQIVAERPRQ